MFRRLHIPHTPYSKTLSQACGMKLDMSARPLYIAASRLTAHSTGEASIPRSCPWLQLHEVLRPGGMRVRVDNVERTNPANGEFLR